MLHNASKYAYNNAMIVDAWDYYVYYNNVTI